MSWNDAEKEIWNARTTGDEPTIALTPAVRRALGEAMRFLGRGDALDNAAADIVTAQLEELGYVHIYSNFSTPAELKASREAAEAMTAALDSIEEDE